MEILAAIEIFELVRRGSRRICRLSDAKGGRPSHVAHLETCSLGFVLLQLAAVVLIPTSESHRAKNVTLQRSYFGSKRVFLLIAIRTCSAEFFSSLKSMTKRLEGSTSVPMHVLLVPMMRSPSQCPGTARSATSGGRSLMRTMFGMRPYPFGRCFLARRAARPLCGA